MVPPWVRSENFRKKFQNFFFAPIDQKSRETRKYKRFLILKFFSQWSPLGWGPKIFEKFFKIFFSRKSIRNREKRVNTKDFWFWNFFPQWSPLDFQKFFFAQIDQKSRETCKYQRFLNLIWINEVTESSVLPAVHISEFGTIEFYLVFNSIPFDDLTSDIDRNFSFKSIIRFVDWMLILMFDVTVFFT